MLRVVGFARPHERPVSFAHQVVERNPGPLLERPGDAPEHVQHLRQFFFRLHHVKYVTKLIRFSGAVKKNPPSFFLEDFLVGIPGLRPWLASPFWPWRPSTPRSAPQPWT